MKTRVGDEDILMSLQRYFEEAVKDPFLFHESQLLLLFIGRLILKMVNLFLFLCINRQRSDNLVIGNHHHVCHEHALTLNDQFKEVQDVLSILKIIFWYCTFYGIVTEKKSI